MNGSRMGLLVAVLLANACGGVRDEEGAAEASGAEGASAVTASAYCAARGGSTAYEWIDGFTLQGVARSTGNNGGYYDATGLAAIAVPHRAASTITLRSGYAGYAYPELWSVWIDYNHDGAFSDDERALSGSAATALTGTFTPPSRALLGPTVMRIAMSYGAAAASCGTSTWGEVEDHVVDIRGVPVAVDGVVFSSTDIPIGERSSYAITVTNRTSSVLTGLYVQGYVDQGSASRAAGGAMLLGCGTAYGDLAPGSCTMDWSLGASNTGAGSGTLVAGPATARIELRDSTTIYATWQVPIALSAVSSVALDGLKFTTTALPIGGSTQYVATISNRTSSLATGLYLQGYIDQGTASRAANGATLVGCGGSAYGDLAPGTCTMNWSLGASNSASGHGTLVPGPATARIELRTSSTIYATWRVPITL